MFNEIANDEYHMKTGYKKKKTKPKINYNGET